MKQGDLPKREIRKMGPTSSKGQRRKNTLEKKRKNNETPSGEGKKRGYRSCGGVGVRNG